MINNDILLLPNSPVNDYYSGSAPTLLAVDIE